MVLSSVRHRTQRFYARLLRQAHNLARIAPRGRRLIGSSGTWRAWRAPCRFSHTKKPGLRPDFPVVAGYPTPRPNITTVINMRKCLK
jgi:hypothetical protein